MNTDTKLVLDVTVGDGKYTIQQTKDGNLWGYRHGELKAPWRNLTGDGLVCALAHEVERLRMILDAIEDANLNDEGVLNGKIESLIQIANEGGYPTT